MSSRTSRLGKSVLLRRCWWCARGSPGTGATRKERTRIRCQGRRVTVLACIKRASATLLADVAILAAGLALKQGRAWLAAMDTVLAAKRAAAVLTFVLRQMLARVVEARRSLLSVINTLRACMSAVVCGRLPRSLLTAAVQRPVVLADILVRIVLADFTIAIASVLAVLVRARCTMLAVVVCTRCAVLAVVVEVTLVAVGISSITAE